jgi:hypothetical protein
MDQTDTADPGLISACGLPYPMFQACKNYTIYPFWLELFDKLSMGRFPEYIVGFDPKTIRLTFRYTVKYRAQIREVVFTKTAKPLNAWGLYRLTTKYLMYFGMHSRSQLPKSSFPPKFQYTSWSNVRSKSVKEEMISAYVDRAYPDEPDKFFEILSLIQTKQINPDDISLSDGVIVSITINPPEPLKPVKFIPYERIRKKNTMSVAIKSFTKERLKRHPVGTRVEGWTLAS